MAIGSMPSTNEVFIIFAIAIASVPSPQPMTRIFFGSNWGKYKLIILRKIEKITE
jgi:hypothetical protein